MCEWGAVEVELIFSCTHRPNDHVKDLSGYETTVSHPQISIVDTVLAELTAFVEQLGNTPNLSKER